MTRKLGSIESLLDWVGLTVDPDSELFAVLKTRLTIANEAVQLCNALENSNVVDAAGRAGIDRILSLHDNQPERTRTYRGTVVQRCYINVEVEVADGTSLDEVARIMQEQADAPKGTYESDATDIEEVRPIRYVPNYVELADKAGAICTTLGNGEEVWMMTTDQLCKICNNVGAQDENADS